MISTIQVNMSVQEILNVCDPLDIDFSIGFIFPQTYTSATCTYPTAKDTKKYKIYVLSVRNDVDYLGELDDEIRVASGNIRHMRLNEYTSKYAIIYGHLDCLKYLHENGYPWDKWSCEYAALNGHLDCLKYAHENGCSWDKNTCDNAAPNNHLDCLKYAHENGCPWDESTYRNALHNNHQHILGYLIANNCPQ